jgi:hypothetical protein
MLSGGATGFTRRIKRPTKEKVRRLLHNSVYAALFYPPQKVYRVRKERYVDMKVGRFTLGLALVFSLVFLGQPGTALAGVDTVTLVNATKYEVTFEVFERSDKAATLTPDFGRIQSLGRATKSPGQSAYFKASLRYCLYEVKGTVKVPTSGDNYFFVPFSRAFGTFGLNCSEKIMHKNKRLVEESPNSFKVVD